MAEAGGRPDEFSFSLCLHGEELRPSDVTALLGVEPTLAFERGHRRKPTSRPMPHGAWFLQARGQPPEDPDELARAVLMRVAVPAETWAMARRRDRVRLRVAMHTAGWNRGFAFSPATLQLIAQTGAELGFDLHFEDAIES